MKVLTKISSKKKIIYIIQFSDKRMISNAGWRHFHHEGKGRAVRMEVGLPMQVEFEEKLLKMVCIWIE